MSFLQIIEKRYASHPTSNGAVQIRKNLSHKKNGRILVVVALSFEGHTSAGEKICRGEFWPLERAW